MSDIAKTTYILDLKGGKKRRVTVPSDWKVTFGPLTPGVRDVAQHMALRFYEGKEKQRAVFMDVVAFRDDGIPVEEFIKKTKRQTVTKDTPEGAKAFVVEATISEWRNPDDTHEPGDEFTALPAPEDLDFTSD